MTLLIEKDPSQDWTFKEIKTRKFTHGLHQYPARMLPKFNNTSTRSAIGLKANGKLMLQFGLMGEYPEEEKQFRYGISKMDDLQKIVDAGKSEPAIPAEKWLPHKDMFLSILKDVFVQE